MSALGQKRTCAVQEPMSALPPIAIAKADIHVEIIFSSLSVVEWPATPRQKLDYPTVSNSQPLLDTPEFGLRNPQRPKELADLISQSIRLLHGGEVSSALHDSPAANVSIDPLSHRTRWSDDLFWELAVTHRNIDCALDGPRAVHSGVIRMKGRPDATCEPI